MGKMAKTMGVKWVAKKPKTINDYFRLKPCNGSVRKTLYY